MSERTVAIRLITCGIALAVLEILCLSGLLVVDPDLGLRLVSMIAASHLGGRLAFIAAGFEGGFSATAITLIATFHNTVVLLLFYPLLLLLWQRIDRFPFLARFRDKAQLRRGLCTRWNLIGIAIFIWVPAPMTGSLVGAILANIEGYGPRSVLAVALGAMAAGVISWTFAFEQLYAWLREIGSDVTIVFTLALVFLPLVVNSLPKRNSAQFYPPWRSPKT